MRAFLAIDFPASVKETYAEALHGFQRAFPSLRWVRPECLHVTLCFLGEIPEEMAEGLRPRVSQAVADFAPRRVSIGAPGSFGPPSAPRVYWFALEEDSGDLERLQPRLEAACREAGVRELSDRRKRKAWTPHLTVARSRGEARGGSPASALAWQEEATRSPLCGAGFQANELALMSSELTPRGPVYSSVWRERAPS